MRARHDESCTVEILEYDYFVWGFVVVKLFSPPAAKVSLVWCDFTVSLLSIDTVNRSYVIAKHRAVYGNTEI